MVWYIAWCLVFGNHAAAPTYMLLSFSFVSVYCAVQAHLAVKHHMLLGFTETRKLQVCYQVQTCLFEFYIGSC